MKKLQVFLLGFISLVLVACDPQPQKTVEAPKPPPTAVEVNLRVIELAQAGKPVDALRVGEDFLKTNSDPQGALHATLAKLYAEVGDAESSVRHLQKVNVVPSGGTTVIVTHESLNTQPAPAPVQPTPGVGASTNGAAAMIGPNGIEVRAGGASASVRN